MRGRPLPLPMLQYRWMTAFTVLGIAARSVRYLLHFPLWEDESFLCVSVMRRSYRELMGALDYHQAAPVPFLWLQKAVTDLVGFNEWSLRLVAYATGIASLFLFRRVVSRLLDGWSRVAAFGMFAVAYPGIRYAAEAKPYGMDLFVSLVVMTCVVEWLAARRQRWLWLLAIAAPTAVAMSLPAAMVVGAASLVVCHSLWLDARPGARRLRAATSDWAAWALMNLLALAAGLGVVFLLRDTMTGELAYLRNFWRADFPPVGEPWRIPIWLLQHLAGDYLAIPFGGGNYGSTLTLGLAVAGVAALWRQRQRTVLFIALAPVAMNLGLAVLQLYPFGGAVKFALYEMPMVCVVAGAGIAWALTRPAWTEKRRQQVTAGVLCGVAAVAIVSMARDAIHPYKTMSDARARQWARQFWAATEPPGERVDLKTDLGIDFSTPTFQQLSWSATYLVNQRIYSPRLQRGAGVNWARISRAWPLLVAEYHDAGKPYDPAGRDRWLASLAPRFALIGTQDVPMDRYDKSERRLLTADFVRVYTFVPRDDGR